MVLGLAALAWVAVGDRGEDDTQPTTTSFTDRTPLPGFGEVQVTFTSPDGATCTACLLSAMTGEQRARGLMEVTDVELGGYDGMLFSYDQEIAGSFWMRNTPMPLSIAYFDDTRTAVDLQDMEPCEDSPSCRSYPAAEPFQYAVEVPQGLLDELGIDAGSTFVVDSEACTIPGPDREG